MAKAWKEVIASSAYQTLPQQQKIAAQEQYFNEVVAPKVGDDVEQAKQQFYAAYPVNGSELSAAQMANLDIPTDEIMAYHDKQKPEQSPQVQDPFTEAGKGLLQTGVNVANIIPEIADTFMSGASWAGNQLGIGDDAYTPAQRLELPDNLKPQDPYAKLGAEIGPYFIPGVGAERTAAAFGSAENSVGALAQNSQSDNGQSLATDLGVGVAESGLARAITPILGKAYNAVVQRTVSPSSTDINTANDIVQLARSKAGRESIAEQAAKIDLEVAKAADVTGIDINTLTPGMRSGSTGIAQTEGVLSSTPGIAQDAHMKAFDEIKSKLNKNLEELGAEAGTASEKSVTIKERVRVNLDEMKDAEWKAWNDVRSTMPNQKMRMANANTVVQAENSAGVPLSTEMKQFVSAYKKGGYYV